MAPIDILLRVSIVLNVVLIVARLVRHVRDSKYTGDLTVVELSPESDKPPLDLTLHFNPFDAEDGSKAIFKIHRI